MSKRAEPVGTEFCRVCGGLQPTQEKGPFVKFGPRHYAHMACFIASGKKLTLLTPRQFHELHRWVSKRKRGKE